MIDPRMTRLAELLIGHSTGLQADEHILIEAFDAPDEMVIELVKAAYNAGGHPHVALRNNRVMRSIEREASEEQLKTWADIDIYRMKKMACYIGLRGSHNVSERSDVPSQQMKKFSHHYMHPVHIDHRVKNTRWCVLRWPSPSMAQLAQMSTEAFEEFYFNACVLDYAKMAESVKPLAERMSKTDQVHIQGPGETDLHFSIKDIPGHPVHRQPQRSRWRMLHVAGPRQRQRRDPLQHADDLQRRVVRKHSAGIQGRQGRQFKLRWRQW
jgi:aminopeptidase